MSHSSTTLDHDPLRCCPLHWCCVLNLIHRLISEWNRVLIPAGSSYNTGPQQKLLSQYSFPYLDAISICWGTYPLSFILHKHQDSFQIHAAFQYHQVKCATFERVLCAASQCARARNSCTSSWSRLSCCVKNVCCFTSFAGCCIMTAC